MYLVQAEKGTRKESDPGHHENTAEVYLVLSGKINVTVAGDFHELGPSMALRFKALQDRYFDILEKNLFF